MGKGGPLIGGRREVVRAAAAANVSVAEIDRARVLGQLAGLLLAHERLRDNLAYKGGAIMHLVDGSPRRSNDLDAHAVTSGPIKKEWLIAALSTPAARRVVFAPPRRFREDNNSITIIGLDCHPPSGRGKIQVTMNISWESPLCLQHAWQDITVGDRTIRIPVMHRTERCAEKLAAFLRRDEVNDTYDLSVYAARLVARDWKLLLPEVVHVKLAHDARWMDGTDMQAVFDECLGPAEREWARNATALGIPAVPSWAQVSAALVRYRDVLPAKLDKRHRRPRG